MILTLCHCSSWDHNKFELLRFPYPYKAALAICSDIDETTPEEFLGIQRWLCTPDTTALGPGLNLEIGNSFWMYNQFLAQLEDKSISFDSAQAQFIGYPDSGLSWFDGVSDSLSDYANIFPPLIRSGYLDCLHSYGHFNDNGFDRTLAQTAVTALRREGPTIPVFVNHNAPQNTHNVGPQPYQRGDNPNAREYHTDWTVDSLGVRFVWDGRVTHCIGQSGDWSFDNLLKSIYEWARPRLSSGAPRFPFGNDLTYPMTLDDGRRAYGFTRFISAHGGTTALDADALADQLSEDNLDELVANRGSMIVYTHLGRNPGPPYLSGTTVSALRELALRYREGEILVATTSRLLNYHVLHESLQWEQHIQNDTLVIRTNGTRNPVDAERVLSVTDLTGISFRIPNDVPVRLLLSDHSIEFETVPNPDDQDSKIIAIPWRKLHWPVLVDN